MHTYPHTYVAWDTHSTNAQMCLSAAKPYQTKHQAKPSETLEAPEEAAVAADRAPRPRVAAFAQVEVPPRVG